jgi:hypothetical protein
MIQLITPALTLLSLRARVRGQKPHVVALDHVVLSYIETGAFANLTPADFAEARTIQRRNNRRNAPARSKAVAHV